MQAFAVTADSRSLDDLVPEFRDKVVQLLDTLKSQGFVFHPTSTKRDPFMQARYWRRSRTSDVVEAELSRLRSLGAPTIADILDSVGPQASGPWATNALPGMSYHQWQEAMDAVMISNGKILNNENHPGYVAYAAEATKLGLKCLRGMGDYDHVQLRSVEIPQLMTLPQIDAHIKELYGL